jgi:hypothetical protein
MVQRTTSYAPYLMSQCMSPQFVPLGQKDRREPLAAPVASADLPTQQTAALP